MADESGVEHRQLPGYWRFVWMLFMQPLTLRDWLGDCGVVEPAISGWKWLRQRRTLDGNGGLYMARLLFTLIAVPAMALLLAWVGVEFFHLPFSIGQMARVMTFGVALGVLLGVATSVAVGVVYGVGFGVATGVVAGVAVGVVGGVAYSLAIGVAFGVACGVAISVAYGMARGVALGVRDVAFLIALSRLPLYPFETLWQLLLTAFSGDKPERTLRYAPILFHDLSYLPHPGLARHIVAAAAHDPGLAQRVLRAASRSPGQKRAAIIALAELNAIELRTLISAGRFADIVALHGVWLPGPTTDSRLLLALSDTARFMLAAQGSASPHICLQHLEAARQQLQGIDNMLLTSTEPLARFLPLSLNAWRDALEAARSSAASATRDILPNPFVAGTPLSPGMFWGRAMFRGREKTINQIEGLLADQHGTTSIALIGPRRCGKSSLLNMLSSMLPDTLVVLFDLQAHPVDTPTAFYHALAATAQTQAQRERGLALPDFPQGPPIEALKQWFDLLEQFTACKRIMICIDEFERLETLFPDQGRELLQLMGLLRATIQHSRRLRLLVAGAAPFDELGKIWNDHFINLREFRLGYFDQATACALLTRPIEEFPPTAIPAAVAAEIFQRSRGQPFLTQAYGHTLVELLNYEKRKTATLADVETIEPDVLSNQTYYFRNIWQDVPPDGQRVLAALAAATPPAQIDIDKKTQLWLRRRQLIDEPIALTIPVFGRWICEKDAL